MDTIAENRLGGVLATRSTDCPPEEDMRAEIRHLLTPDINPGSYVPDDPGCFAFTVQLLAGPAGGPGEESFQFQVCTPGWLERQVRQHGPRNGRHHVVVDSFDWPGLQEYFRRLVSSCTGTDWPEVAAKLARHGHWEFEDYAPAPAGDRARD